MHKGETRMKATLKELTWKYFIQSKFKEIIWTAIILVAIIFIPYLLGHSIGDNKSYWCDDSDFCESQYNWDYCNENAECGKVTQWGEGLLYLIIGAVSLFVVGLIIYLWFSCNWEKAEKKARKELKTSQKRRKTQ